MSQNTRFHVPAFDRDLIRRYDRPGPRYTSYPTAPVFTEDFGVDDYRELLRRTSDPLSVYLHLPFCRTLCFYCGCNVVVSRSQDRASDYLATLRAEVDAVLAETGSGRRVVQIHLGGGTPTFFPPERLAEILGFLRERFDVDPDCEIGIEVDPRTTTEAHLDVLAEGGVNRLSVGLQDLDPQVQQAVNRIQSEEQTAGVIEGAHRRGISSVNLDLIYGLPHQTPETFARTVAKAIAMAPERVALFNFAYLPLVLPHQKVIDPEALPSGEEKLTILEDTIAALTKAGWVFIGMDHFARPDDPLTVAQQDGTLIRNFQGYSTGEARDLLGFGASAIGGLADGFAQNRKGIAEYTRAVLEEGGLATWKGVVRTPDDRLRWGVIQDLMCFFRLDKAAVERRFDLGSFDETFASELTEMRPMADDGLVEIDEREIRVTDQGRLLVRNVAMVFDAHLARQKERAFSRTV